MFFVLSKIVWIVLRPLTLLLLLLGAGLFLRRLGWRRAGGALLALSLGGLVLLDFTTLGDMALAPLENRFPTVAALPPDVTGLIVLGGAVEAGPKVAERGQVALNDGAERMTEAVALARRHPDARIAFTGFSGALMPDGPSEAEVARRFFESLGVDPARVTYEDRSRNTAENARFLKDIIAPKDGETWALITSAAHLPRAVGCFRQVDWAVLPYPVDFTLRPSVPFTLRPSGGGLGTAGRALHEWLGLLVYRLTGRTPTLFPAPDPTRPPSTSPAL